MKNLGLVSVSFRNLSCEEIVKLCIENGLTSVEWGGDIHIPAGDIAAAEEAFALCQKSNIEIAAYGSYYRVCKNETVNPPWEKVVETAAALHAPIIRVWICEHGSEEVSDDEFQRAVKECREICDIAQKQNITVCCECHPNTLTDNYIYTVKLLKQVDRPNFKLYWQPNQHKSIEYNLEAIRSMKDYTLNVHTFYWEGINKLSLSCGVSIWKKYLEALGDVTPRFLLEFMPNGLTAEIPGEIKAFNEIVNGITK